MCEDWDCGLGLMSCASRFQGCIFLGEDILDVAGDQSCTSLWSLRVLNWGLLLSELEFSKLEEALSVILQRESELKAFRLLRALLLLCDVDSEIESLAFELGKPKIVHL